ncbi:MAG: LytTR family DNA-binding domain-containing protein [Bacteroidota bacterium]
METKIDSIIIDQEPSSSSRLRKCLAARFPNIAVQGEASDCMEAKKLVKAKLPALVFLDVNVLDRAPISVLWESDHRFEVILLSNALKDAITALRQGACGFILKPIEAVEVVASVESALLKLASRTQQYASEDPAPFNFPQQTQMIGVPTIDGINFLSTHEIIRCEGLQKCTRVISTRNRCLISAYNIGEFRKILEECGFFTCHKSHLINLMYVKKLTREDFILLGDKESVPLARRKRVEFLQRIRHL